MEPENANQESPQEVFLNVLESDLNYHFEQPNHSVPSEYVAPWQVFDEPQ